MGARICICPKVNLPLWRLEHRAADVELGPTVNAARSVPLTSSKISIVLVLIVLRFFNGTLLTQRHEKFFLGHFQFLCNGDEERKYSR